MLTSSEKHNYDWVEYELKAYKADLRGSRGKVQIDNKIGRISALAFADYASKAKNALSKSIYANSVVAVLDKYSNDLDTRPSSLIARIFDQLGNFFMLRGLVTTAAYLKKVSLDINHLFAKRLSDYKEELCDVMGSEKPDDSVLATRLKEMSFGESALSIGITQVVRDFVPCQQYQEEVLENLLFIRRCIESANQDYAIDQIDDRSGSDSVLSDKTDPPLVLHRAAIAFNLGFSSHSYESRQLLEKSNITPFKD